MNIISFLSKPAQNIKEKIENRQIFQNSRKKKYGVYLELLLDTVDLIFDRDETKWYALDLRIYLDDSDIEIDDSFVDNHQN